MIKIHEMLDMQLLAQMMGDGYIRSQKHPTAPYVIYNYTEKAAYEGVWNEVTRQCRGLIVNAETGEIVARPFKKFFNYGQAGAPKIDMSGQVHVTDKADGSLGILYPMPDGSWAIATRGSFTSEQALHATKLFNERYASRWAPRIANTTFLFEIIYPENRIVLDYEGMNDLVLLGTVHNRDGDSLNVYDKLLSLMAWPGPYVKSFEFNSLEEALSAPLRENAEGLVVHFLDSDERLKIKQDDYAALHRIITNTSLRTVWEYLAVNACKHLQGTLIKRPHHWGTYLGLDGQRATEILAVGDNWLEDLAAKVPDEFYAWLGSSVARLNGAALMLESDLRQKLIAYKRQAMELGDTHRRTLWRLMANETHEHRGMMMAMFDGHDVTPALWKSIYPEVELPFKMISEDVA